MFYTLACVCFGIYIGQEYPMIPSLKSMVSECVQYFQRPEQNSLWDTLVSGFKRE